MILEGVMMVLESFRRFKINAFYNVSTRLRE